MTTEYFIKADGSDSASGLSEASAWRTYPVALPRLNEGDTLTQIGDIVGDLLIDSQTQLFADRIRVRGKPGTVATMTPGGNHAIRFYSRMVDGLVLENLVLDARNLPPIPTFLPVLFADTCMNTQFLNIEVKNAPGVATQFGYNSHDCLWDGGSFHDIADHACYMVGHHNTFRRLSMRNVGRWGFHVYSMEGSHDRCSFNLIEDCVFDQIGVTDPSAAAIMFGWGHDNLARNNRVRRAQVGLCNYNAALRNRFLFNSLDTCRVGLAEQYYDERAEFTGNIVAFSKKFAYIDADTLVETVPVGNFVGDPKWASDYQLQPDSPCIGAIARHAECQFDATSFPRENPTSFGCFDVRDMTPVPPDPTDQTETFEVVGGSLTLRRVTR